MAGPKELMSANGLPRLQPGPADPAQHPTAAGRRALAALPALHTLDLTECGLVTLPPALSAATSLRELTLLGNRQLQPRSLRLLAGLPHLCYVDLRQCGRCSGLKLPIGYPSKLQAMLAAL